MPEEKLENINELVETAENQSSKNQEPRSKNKILWWILGIVILAGVGYGAYYYMQNQNIQEKPSQPEKKEALTTNNVTFYKTKDGIYSDDVTKKTRVK